MSQPSRIVTSARCVVDQTKETMSIVLGEFDISSTDDIFDTQRYFHYCNIIWKGVEIREEMLDNHQTGSVEIVAFVSRPPPPPKKRKKKKKDPPTIIETFSADPI